MEPETPGTAEDKERWHGSEWLAECEAAVWDDDDPRDISLTVCACEFGDRGEPCRTLFIFPGQNVWPRRMPRRAECWREFAWTPDGRRTGILETDPETLTSTVSWGTADVEVAKRLVRERQVKFHEVMRLWEKTATDQLGAPWWCAGPFRFRFGPLGDGSEWWGLETPEGFHATNVCNFGDVVMERRVKDETWCGENDGDRVRDFQDCTDDWMGELRRQLNRPQGDRHELDLCALESTLDPARATERREAREQLTKSALKV